MWRVFFASGQKDLFDLIYFALIVSGVVMSMSLRMPLTALVLLTLAYSVLVCPDYHNFPYDDGAEHGAVVREWSHNLLNPGEPMLDAYHGKSARYVPSSFLMAITSRLLNIETLLVVKLFSIAYFIFFGVSLSLFVASYFEDTRSVVWSLLAVLFLWGTGWSGANAYMFSAILSTAYFPSVVSFSLSLLALYFQMRFIKTGSMPFVILQYSSASVAFVCHPLTWVFYCVCSTLLCYERQGGSIKAMLITVFVSVISALCAVAVWPYYDFVPNFLNVASGGLGRTASDYQITRSFLYSDILLRTGPALAGIFAVIFFARKRKYFMLWGGCAVFAAMYAAGYFFHISLAERCVFFAVFLLQLSFARICWLTCGPGPLRVLNVIKKNIAGICVVLLLVGIVLQCCLVWRDVVRPCFSLHAAFPFVRYESPNRLQAGLGDVVGPGDVVLTDIFSGWSIPVYTGARVVALLHTPPHIPDNNLRVDDSNNFFISGRSIDEKKEILRRYAPTHILLNYRIMGKNMEPVLRGMGCELVAQGNAYVVFSVR